MVCWSYSAGFFLVLILLGVCHGAFSGRPLSISRVRRDRLSDCGNSLCSRQIIHRRFATNPSFDADVAFSKVVKECKIKSAQRDTLRFALDSCPELCQVLLDLDFHQWLNSFGKGHLLVPKLLNAIERHPLLASKALKSKRLHTTKLLLTNRAAITEEQFQRKFVRESLPRKRVRQVLYFLESLGFSSDELNKIIMSQPKLFAYNVERFQEVVHFLSPLVDVRPVIQRWPTILTYSVQGRLQPGVAFLKSLGDTRWERMILRYPQVLSHSVETVLLPKLTFLQQFLNIPSSKQLVTHYPPLLWLSSDLLKRKFYFIQQSLELTREEMECVVESYPQVLGLSLENNLKPTIRYLQTYLSEEQLRDFVLYQPALLAYSLPKRIRPRLERMKDMDIAFAYAPAYLMSMTDRKFDQWCVLHLKLMAQLPNFCDGSICALTACFAPPLCLESSFSIQNLGS